MIVYLDTSAVVPILISEPSSDLCRRIWVDADRRVSSVLTYVETAAALAMAERLGRIEGGEHDAAWSNFLAIWQNVDVVKLTTDLTVNAAQLARTLQLRGYDAVHCASAAAVHSDGVAASGDARLLAAWQELGLIVLDTNQV